MTIAATLDFAERSSAFGDAKIAAALFDWLTHHCHIIKPGHESIRRAPKANNRIKAREHIGTGAKQEPPDDDIRQATPGCPAKSPGSMTTVSG